MTCTAVSICTSQSICPVAYMYYVAARHQQIVRLVSRIHHPHWTLWGVYFSLLSSYFVLFLELSSFLGEVCASQGSNYSFFVKQFVMEMDWFV